MNSTVFTDHRADGILDVHPILAIALDSRLHILEDSSQSISSVICDDRYVLAIDGAPPPVLQVAIGADLAARIPRQLSSSKPAIVLHNQPSKLATRQQAGTDI